MIKKLKFTHIMPLIAAALTTIAVIIACGSGEIIDVDGNKFGVGILDSQGNLEKVDSLWNSSASEESSSSDLEGISSSEELPSSSSEVPSSSSSEAPSSSSSEAPSSSSSEAPSSSSREYLHTPSCKINTNPIVSPYTDKFNAFDDKEEFERLIVVKCVEKADTSKFSVLDPFYDVDWYVNNKLDIRFWDGPEDGVYSIGIEVSEDAKNRNCAGLSANCGILTMCYKNSATCKGTSSSSGSGGSSSSVAGGSSSSVAGGSSSSVAGGSSSSVAGGSSSSVAGGSSSSYNITCSVSSTAVANSSSSASVPIPTYGCGVGVSASSAKFKYLTGGSTWKNADGWNSGGNHTISIGRKDVYMYEIRCGGNTITLGTAAATDFTGNDSGESCGTINIVAAGTSSSSVAAQSSSSVAAQSSSSVAASSSSVPPGVITASCVWTGGAGKTMYSGQSAPAAPTISCSSGTPAVTSWSDLPPTTLVKGTYTPAPTGVTCGGEVPTSIVACGTLTVKAAPAASCTGAANQSVTLPTKPTQPTVTMTDPDGLCSASGTPNTSWTGVSWTVNKNGAAVPSRQTWADIFDGAGTYDNYRVSGKCGDYALTSVSCTGSATVSAPSNDLFLPQTDSTLAPGTYNVTGIACSSWGNKLKCSNQGTKPCSVTIGGTDYVNNACNGWCELLAALPAPPFTMIVNSETKLKCGN